VSKEERKLKTERRYKKRYWIWEKKLKVSNFITEKGAIQLYIKYMTTMLLLLQL